MDNNYQTILRKPNERYELVVYDTKNRSNSRESYDNVQILHAGPGMIHFIEYFDDRGGEEEEEHFFCSATLYYHIHRVEN